MGEMHPRFLERSKLLDDSVACARTDRVLTAPFYTYLPILLYQETTIAEIGRAHV
mgnify:CR=1 FL=1